MRINFQQLLLLYVETAVFISEAASNETGNDPKSSLAATCLIND